MSQLLRAAFRALNASYDYGYWHHVSTVATLLRASDDRDLEALLGAPMGDREAWDRLQAIAAEFDAGLIALDLKTEYCIPDAHAHLRADGRASLDEAA